MKNKTLISISVILFVTSFFTCAVNAINESKTLEDSQGDVLDENGEAVTGKDQYDIDKILYTNNNGLVTIEIKLHGILTENDNITTEIYLMTYQGNYYIIAYDGIDVLGQLMSAEGESNIDTIDVNLSGVGTNSLKFSFSLKNINDKYQLIIIPAFGEPSEDSATGYLYYDSYPDEDMFYDVEIQGPEKAVVNEEVQFYCNFDEGTPPFTYSWEFNNDDKPDSEIQNPKYKFTEPGNYSIAVIVTDDVGKIGLGETNITISTESSNGNENNDKNSGSGLILFIGLIVIVVIIGIVVVVFIIKR